MNRVAGAILAIAAALVVWRTLRGTYARLRRRGDRWHVCQTCDSAIRRRPGAWLPRCTRCGWTAGWPGLRWLTQSVPSRAARSSIGPLTVAVVLGAVVVTGAAGVGAIGGPAPTTADTGGDGGLEATTTVVNTTAAEASTLTAVSDARTDRGASVLHADGALTTAARAHSETLSDRGSLEHTLDGVGPTERYHCRAGENLYAVDLDAPVTVDGEVTTITTADALAEAAVSWWLASPPHEDIILSDVDVGGVGVAIDDEDRATVTLAVC